KNCKSIKTYSMIEYCSKKIMMTTIGGLIFICILALYLEDALIEHPEAVKADAVPLAPDSAGTASTASSPAKPGSQLILPNPQQVLLPGNRSCLAVGPCIRCSQFESSLSNAKLSSYCVSGYKRRVACPGDSEQKSTPSRFAACPSNLIPTKSQALERGKFFLFHALCFLALLLSGALVQRRQRQLNRSFADRINKQVASGV
ncbi:hypothetical protein BOX15_Mlig017360g1, partial [Macrostomum lignano]